MVRIQIEPTISGVPMAHSLQLNTSITMSALPIRQYIIFFRHCQPVKRSFQAD